MRLTTDRKRAKETEELTLLGLEHPIIRELMEQHRALPADERALVGSHAQPELPVGVVTFWHVEIHGAGGYFQQRVVPLAVDSNGERSRVLERQVESLRGFSNGCAINVDQSWRVEYLKDLFPKLLHRELEYKGLISEGTSFNSRLLAWVENC